ncbi:AAC(3) family N-acetyltransferase [Catellatospora paridis]|uniref:aminoglycoside N(3)-acetyltransferase n=1 Tax=Catellatospora paridis TaxID=1617086 RepID=UPI0012D3B0F4|nr:AAC(3) family N-acetyltransferase [Catellatospora paridis]
MGGLTATRLRTAHDQASLVRDLAALGLPAGRDVLIHCSLRRLGRVDGGPAALLDAVREVIGPRATVVVPTQTADNSTTSRAFRVATEGMDAAGRAAYESALKGFDRDATPSYGMGAFAEHVRRHPGAMRSAHPQTSFAALGPRAESLTAGHLMESHLGEQSPLAGLYAAGAVTLLLGVGYEACTALHLAEYRLRTPRPTRWYRCYVNVGGRRVGHDFLGADLDDSSFPELGAAMDGRPFVRRRAFGDAEARLIDIRAAVDFAADWLSDR